MAVYMMDFFTTVDTFIYGRKSYEAMIAYWPDLKDEFAKVMNQKKKLVFSRTLEKVIWNSQLIKSNAVEKIQQQKKQEGKNLVLFAGADLAETFIKNNLIDEYRLIINPVLLGDGKRLFKKIDEFKKLTLKETKQFKCGNIILIYESSNNIL